MSVSKTSIRASLAVWSAWVSAIRMIANSWLD